MPRRYLRWLVVLMLILTALWVRPAVAEHDAGMGTATGSASSLLPMHAVLDGYPQLYQQHRLSCEAATVSMATHGLLDESTIVAAMPRNRDPWLGFRGDINGHTRLINGLANYGIYAPPLAREMQNFGYQTTVISGTTAPAQLRYSINVLKLPVVVWVTYRLAKEPVILGHSGTHTFQLVHFEHARLIIGYDAHGVYSHDPVDGPRYDTWAAFLHSWDVFNDMGLIIAPPTLTRAIAPAGTGAGIHTPGAFSAAALRGQAPATVPAIFPPMAFFMLPPARVGGATVIIPLPPQDLGSPTKPISRVQYSVASGGLHYRVEVFASALDATTSFAWQMAHPLAGIHRLPAPTMLPGSRRYTIPGYTVAEVLYHNIEFAVSMPTTPRTTATRSARVLSVALALIAQSRGYTGPTAQANPATPISPPPYTFIFSDLGVYTLDGAAHTTPGERFYDYMFHPVGFGAAAVPTYHVMVESSAARATALATAMTRAFVTAYKAVGLRPLNLGDTVLGSPDLYAWAATVPSLHCATWEVFTYHNLWFLLTDSAHDARDSCTARVQSVQSLALRLLGTAQAYAQARQS